MSKKQYGVVLVLIIGAFFIGLFASTLSNTVTAQSRRIPQKDIDIPSKLPVDNMSSQPLQEQALYEYRVISGNDRNIEADINSLAKQGFEVVSFSIADNPHGTQYYAAVLKRKIS